MLTNGLLNGLGIKWDGSLYDGEPRGDLTAKEKGIIQAVRSLPENVDLDVDEKAQYLKGLLTPEQWAKVVAYQQTIKDDQQDELILAAAKSFLKLVYQIGEAGGSLTAANLKPWRDKVKAAIAAKG